MTKANKIIYWIATVWLSLGMVSSAIVQLTRVKEAVDQFEHLGYPIYLLAILGVWKLLGVVAILIPKYPLVKEWAYAGFFFVTSGALISHLAMSDPIGDIFPALLLLVLTVVSWYFRPAPRKIVWTDQ
jgi:uncharacterized membrane protein YphA (DoxX/SURF4 family)